MEDIKRYSLWYEFLDEDEEGDLVNYEDHLAIVEKLKAEIASLRAAVSSINGRIDNMSSDAWERDLYD